jgi:hypothetical protein
MRGEARRVADPEHGQAEVIEREIPRPLLQIDAAQNAVAVGRQVVQAQTACARRQRADRLQRPGAVAVGALHRHRQDHLAALLQRGRQHLVVRHGVRLRGRQRQVEADRQRRVLGDAIDQCGVGGSGKGQVPQRGSGLLVDGDDDHRAVAQFAALPCDVRILHGMVGLPQQPGSIHGHDQCHRGGGEPAPADPAPATPWAMRTRACALGRGPIGVLEARGQFRAVQGRYINSVPWN